MNFLQDIFARLEAAGETTLLQELREGQALTVSGHDLMTRVAKARSFLVQRGLKKGDRCALLAHNGIDWVVLDLAITAEGLIVVPLYARQAPAELVAMMKDCSPAVIACGDKAVADAIVAEWPDAPPSFYFDNVFTARREPVEDSTVAIASENVVTIIYTSGTSGEAKGVMLNGENIS